MYQAQKSVEEIVASIQALDLDPIKFKLMDPEEGEGWTREFVDQMEIAYKRFLTLLVKYPDEPIAPTRSVDKFWHGHILDTMKYAEDCENVFGYFLHHFPYFGMRGESDAADLQEASENLHRIYEREFGEGLAKKTAYCWAAQPVAIESSAYCWAAKPMPVEATAYCWAAKPVVKEASAYCWASKPMAVEASAYCWAAKPVAKEASAYCWAAKPAARETSAYCWAAKPEATEASGYCWAATKAQGKCDVSRRPSLIAAS